ncbi:MAG: 30S ribosomal protein S6 [Ruminococcaceae bacterium]|nr:30S ribosomal protein S6 [Oscillospiraceae bacterium]
MLTEKYETILVFSTSLNEEQLEFQKNRFLDLISENGVVESVDVWGKRRLAYEINKQNDGYYILIYFSSPPSFINELERIYRITDSLLRTIVIKRDKNDEPELIGKRSPENDEEIGFSEEGFSEEDTEDMDDSDSDEFPDSSEDADSELGDDKESKDISEE